MISSAAQLDVALEQVASFADTLEAMRRHSLETNSNLFPQASEAYIKRIQELNAEIREYLGSESPSAEATALSTPR